MRILICGGRDFNDWDSFGLPLLTALRYHMYEYAGWSGTTPLPLQDFVIISGGAPGADTLAIQWANYNNVPFEVYPALWNVHGKSAGFIRNQQMIDEGKPDLVISFPGGNGTKDMITRAMKHNIKVIKIDVNK